MQFFSQKIQLSLNTKKKQIIPNTKYQISYFPSKINENTKQYSLFCLSSTRIFCIKNIFGLFFLLFWEHKEHKNIFFVHCWICICLNLKKLARLFLVRLNLIFQNITFFPQQNGDQSLNGKKWGKLGVFFGPKVWFCVFWERLAFSLLCNVQKCKTWQFLRLLQKIHGYSPSAGSQTEDFFLSSHRFWGWRGQHQTFS